MGLDFSKPSHTWNTQGVQSEIRTCQIHRPATYPAPGVVQIVQPARTDERPPGTFHSIAEHDPREWV